MPGGVRGSRSRSRPKRKTRYPKESQLLGRKRFQFRIGVLRRRVDGVAPSTIPVAISEGFHPFPSRTRKLSPPEPMVLRGKPCGRVGRCRIFFRPRLGLSRRGLFCWAIRTRFFAPCVPAFGTDIRAGGGRVVEQLGL